MKRSTALPSYGKLENVYKGYPGHGGAYTNDAIIKMILTEDDGTNIQNTDSLRISLALSRMGHLIPEQASGTIPDSDGKHYIYDTEVMDSYLEQQYGSPLTTTNKKDISRLQGILITTFNSYKLAGLWNGEKQYHMNDNTDNALNLKLWNSRGEFPFLSPQVMLGQ